MITGTGPTRAVLPVVLLMLAGPPRDYLEEMEEVGKVSYRYYDEKKEKYEYPGNTNFNLNLNRRLTYRYTVTKGRTTRIAIRLTFSTIEVDVKHEIRLPRGYALDHPRYRKMVDHEYDHVAISADERPALLLKHLVSGTRMIERALQPSDRATEEFAKQAIDEEHEKYKDAIVDLIGHNYSLLDRVTEHGDRAIPDRKSFFEGLYTAENLREAGFEYVDRVKGFMEGDDYRRARRYYKD